MAGESQLFPDWSTAKTSFASSDAAETKLLHARKRIETPHFLPSVSSNDPSNDMRSLDVSIRACRLSHIDYFTLYIWFLQNGSRAESDFLDVWNHTARSHAWERVEHLQRDRQESFAWRMTNTASVREITSFRVVNKSETRYFIFSAPVGKFYNHAVHLLSTHDCEM